MPRSTRVFMGNLSHQATERDVEKFFKVRRSKDGVTLRWPWWNCVEKANFVSVSNNTETMLNGCSCFWWKCRMASFINYGKEKKRTLCFASFCLTMGLNHRKSMTVLKLCKKSSKCDVAGHCSFIRLEMAMVWRKKSLIEKSAYFYSFPMKNFSLSFLSIMQLRIIVATRYPWAN